MEGDLFRLIELEDQFVHHQGQFPYGHKANGKPIMMTLRSKKVINYQPILVIDRHTCFDPVLPLRPGTDISSQFVTHNCTLEIGEFQNDGQWTCIISKLSPGILSYQLVFVERRQSIIKDVGGYDAILVRQSRSLLDLCMQTVFPRCIGIHTEWPSFFSKQINLGYNAFHFAPIQQPGKSNSYYSIQDQLQLSGKVFSGSSECRYQQLQAIIKPLQQSGAVFFVDIVLNHTSFDSQWIKDDLRSVFTVENTPCLRSAYDLDTALKQWGNNIKSNFADSQLSMDENQFEEITVSLTNVVNALNLHEYFEIEASVRSQFVKAVSPRPVSDNIFLRDPSEIVYEFIEQHATNIGCCRLGVQIDNLQQKWQQLNPNYQQEDLINGIQAYNLKWRNTIQQKWIPEIISNVLNQIKYNYIEHSYRSYADPYPFVHSYFSVLHCRDGNQVSALNNGWVMNADTLENMVTTRNFYYLRRQVNVWGDLIRIRYGDRPEDSPAWLHMQKYVQKMAEIFDGFRLDNLHGTPLAVAKYLIQQARRRKPEIIIFAQLFTSSSKEAAMFTRATGINSTLTEFKNCMSGPGYMQLLPTVMEHAGKYTGSLSPFFKKGQNVIKYLVRQKPLNLVYDLTHDNNTYEERGLAVVKTPLCLLLGLTGTFIGSTKGFDQFYSHKIEVTDTRHLYLQDEAMPSTTEQCQTMKKKILYLASSNTKVQLLGSWDGWKNPKILQEFGRGRKGTQLDLLPGNYEYKFMVDGEWKCDENKLVNENGNHFFTLQAVKKPVRNYANLEELRKSASQYRKRYQNYRQYYAEEDGDIVCLLRQSKDHEHSIFVIVNLSVQTQTHHRNIKLPGQIVFADIWWQSQGSTYEQPRTAVEIKRGTNLFEHFDYYNNESLGKDVLMGTELPPGFACLIECRKSQHVHHLIKSIKQLKNQPIHLPPLGTLDYNIIMFGIDEQEIVHFSSSNYVIPNQNRKLIFGGFAGVFRELKQAKKYNLLSLPLFDNMREGNWLFDYYLSRLKRYRHMQQFTETIERFFECLKQIPAYLKPKYFTTFIYNICTQVERSITNSSNQLAQKLVLASHQFLCRFDNCHPRFSVTLAAGLPHFSTGWSRSWGRDTFISHQLLLLHPGIYKEIILQFASVLRHGMIPNLLDFGNNPRYNCRDACWWFLRAICQYATHTKDYEILKAKVSMLFLSNDQFEHRKKYKEQVKKIMLLEDVVQSILQSHAHGISYREWNAGFQIDQNMTTDGFNVKLHVDKSTGFVFGGNQSNCLTWMDKMGSSARAGNKGFPGSSRAGAPVQLTALLYYCLVAFDRLHKQGHYKYQCVASNGNEIRYLSWAQRIAENFDQLYFVRENTPQAKYVGIYRDLIPSPQLPNTESLRLRPNALIAMALTPELFNKENALKYLRVVERELISKDSLGVSTLGTAHESRYCPYYDNSDDSVQFKTAHGFSYHNGPEWVWLYGFYVVAKTIFEPELSREQLLALLQPHFKQLSSNPWQSLPEMTDINGKHNQYSCPSQAWSVSSIIMALDCINVKRPMI